MADVVTRTELEDAHVDLQTIEDVVNGAPDLNGDGVVTSRLGREIKTLSNAIEQIVSTPVNSAILESVGYPMIPMALLPISHVDFYREGSGTITPTIYNNVSITSGLEYVAEFVIKRGTRRYLNVFSNSGVMISATFDLLLGSIIGAPTGAAKIFNAGNGVFVLSVVATAVATASANIQLRLSSNGTAFTYSGDGASGVYVASARLTVNGGANIFESTSIAHSSWTKSGASVISASAENEKGIGEEIESLRTYLAPVNGVRITEGAGSVSPSLYRKGNWVSGKTYRVCAIVKTAERARFNIYSNSGPFYNAVFDTVAGSATGSGARLVSLGADEWYVEASGVAQNTSTWPLQIRMFLSTGTHPYVGDGTSGMFILAVVEYEDGAEIARDLGNALAGWTMQGGTVAQSSAAIYRDVESRITGLAMSASSGNTNLSGMKYAALGTSETAQAQYYTPLIANSGMIGVNLGVGGASIAAGPHYGSEVIYDQIASVPSDTQILTVECGINDFGTSNSELGSLGDTTTATFFGAIYAARAAIKATAPNAHVIWIVPFSGGLPNTTHRIGVTNARGLKLEQFQDALKRTAEWVGDACLDSNETGIGYFTADVYTSDGLHLNATGGARYAAWLYAELLRLKSQGYFS